MSDSRRHSAGKGDSPRPVDYKKWSDNWDRIFGKNKNKTEKIENKNITDTHGWVEDKDE